MYDLIYLLWIACHLEDAIHHQKEVDLQIVVHIGEALTGEVVMGNLLAMMVVGRICMIMSESVIGAAHWKGFFFLLLTVSSLF